MIDRAVAVLAAQLDETLRERFGSSVPVAAAGAVPDLGKDPSALPAQPVVLTLVRVEEDRIARSPVATRKRSDGAIEEVQPEVKLHLYLLVCVAAKEYVDSLRYLAAVVGFFQSKPCFDNSNTPALDPAMGKIIVELAPLTFEEQSNLWGMLSVRYLPSVLYRARTVVAQESSISRLLPPVSSIETDLFGHP